jgi:hypothetical protein
MSFEWSCAASRTYDLLPLSLALSRWEREVKKVMSATNTSIQNSSLKTQN